MLLFNRIGKWGYTDFVSLEVLHFHLPFFLILCQKKHKNNTKLTMFHLYKQSNPDVI